LLRRPISPIGELVIYAAPISLIHAAIVVAMAYCGPPGTVDKAMRVLYIFVSAGSWVPWGIGVAILLYPLYRIWNAAGVSNITHHLFSSDGIELSRATGTTLLPWSGLSRVIETPKSFLFYQGSRMAAFVPRRCLQGDAEINIIRKFAGKYVDNAKLLA
jgi:hypothetical protein